jgi:tetratricopeptide (TPR) repeat protein
MIKKTISILIILSLFVAGIWCLVFKAYYDTSDEIAQKLSLGDWPGALDSLKSYQSSILSYPVYNSSKLKKFRSRLVFLEGIVANDTGNFDMAAASFRKAARSQEIAVSAASKYNLAYYAIKDNNIGKAKSLLNEALMMAPNDVEAKINLELILKTIQARQILEPPEKTKKKDSIKPQAEPGEQWRLDVPDEEGEGSGASPGRSFL